MERRTLVYSSVLALLVIALGVVGVLILRKRGVLPPLVPLSGTQNVRRLPTDTKPLDAYPTSRPWQEGDPVPSVQTEIIGFPAPGSPPDGS